MRRTRLTWRAAAGRTAADQSAVNQLAETIRNWESDEQVFYWWNKYCDTSHGHKVYPNNETGINEIFEGRTPFDVLYYSDNSDYDPENDDWIRFNDDGYLVGMDAANDGGIYSPVDFDALAKWILDNNNEDALRAFRPI